MVARKQEQDKIAALDAGADDDLTKPFGVSELLARIRVALRHAQTSTGTGQKPIGANATCEVMEGVRALLIGSPGVTLIRPHSP